jgi:uncharacterized membrane protein YphA (DoxX/SURF4 family)
MKIALDIFGVLLAVISIGSAGGKLVKVPDIMASMASVGVKKSQVPVLASLEIAGGLGLLVGIWSKPLGVLSAACLALYFFGAVASHVKNKHGVSEFGPALGIMIIAVVTTFLQLQR